jgi:diadenosine tetraphosphate (Ap4A) HIT family hydrolase
MPTLFTRILNGDIPGTFVYRDDRCAAFLSINPLAEGHVLVVPVEEVDHWVELSPTLAGHLFQVSHRLGNALQTAFPCERVGMIIAGYEVNHCHIHLIPTQDIGQFNFANAQASVEREVLEQHALRIVGALESL